MFAAVICCKAFVLAAANGSIYGLLRIGFDVVFGGAGELLEDLNFHQRGINFAGRGIVVSPRGIGFAERGIIPPGRGILSPDRGIGSLLDKKLS